MQRNGCVLGLTYKVGLLDSKIDWKSRYFISTS